MSLFEAIERVAAARFGARERKGEALARAVQRVSAAYTRRAGSPVDLGDDASLCARLKFFLPRDFPKIVAPLAELASVGALSQKRSLKILDLGAGLGATGLAAARFCLRHAGATAVAIDAIDRDLQALELARALVLELARTEALALTLKPRVLSLEAALAARLDPPYQLIVLGFVLNELAPIDADNAGTHAALLARLAPLLDADGAIIVLEPALRATSRNLQRVRGLFAATGSPLHVFAPCLQLGDCPLLERERDWCHAELPLALPPPLAAIARAAELRTSDLTYSYLTLHKNARSLAELDPERSLLRAVSSLLRSKGKLELAVCGASATRKLRRLDRHASESNRSFEEAARGTILGLAREQEPEPVLRDLRGDDSLALTQQISGQSERSAPSVLKSRF